VYQTNKNWCTSILSINAAFQITPPQDVIDISEAPFKPPMVVQMEGVSEGDGPPPLTLPPPSSHLMMSHSQHLHHLPPPPTSSQHQLLHPSGSSRSWYESASSMLGPPSSLAPSEAEIDAYFKGSCSSSAYFSQMQGAYSAVSQGETS